MSFNPTATTAPSSFQDTDRTTEAVVNAVADAEGASPLELRPLATVIDPDALNELFRGDMRGRAVEFSYHGYRVRVSSDGEVAVSEGDDVQ